MQVFQRLILFISTKPIAALNALRYVARRLPFREKIFFVLLVFLLAFSAFSVVVSMSSAYAREVPAEGGSFTEGIIGTPRFINPLIAISDSDRDLTMLVYSGLLRPDGNGGLMPDLAERYEISEDGMTYTFTIREHALWHDGRPVTSDDVLFTVREAKNPSLKSPKRANWEGVEAEKVDDRVVRFRLRRPYAPFLENATLGILPKHLWEGATAERMALSEFNINPVGSGPYKVQKVLRNSSGIITAYALSANNQFLLGKPFIKHLTLKFYPSEDELITAYNNGFVDAASSISPQRIGEVRKNGNKLHALNLPRVFAVFLNQNTAPAFAELAVRKALAQSIDKERVIAEVFSGYATALSGPIPSGTFGAPERGKPTMPDVQNIRASLEKAGWKFNEERGVLEKLSRGKKLLELSFSLATSNSPDLVATAQLLKSAWEQLGAKVAIRIFELGDLNQRVIRPREYDALLFGEVVGLDPDPFAFWHSSQRNDPGLNIALYANITVDRLLEEARMNVNLEKRKVTYKKFQQEIRDDMPAVFLYSPQYLYMLPERVRGVNVSSIAVPSDRFVQIYNWFTETRKIWPIFIPKIKE